MQHRRGIARGADDAAMPSAKRFQTGRRVDVSDWRDIGRVEQLAQFVPAVFDLVDGGHVGHRAAGS